MKRKPQKAKITVDYDSETGYQIKVQGEWPRSLVEILYKKLIKAVREHKATIRREHDTTRRTSEASVGTEDEG